MTVPPPRLLDAARVLLPDAIDALFLRACLGDAATAPGAWTALRAEREDLAALLTERPRLSRLLPLLHHSLLRHGVAIAEPVCAVLRAAMMWESRRAARIREITLDVLAVLDRAAVPVLLLKGVALAETVYPEPRLRHCHDLDLLLETASLDAARVALIGGGYLPAATAEGAACSLQHADGFPITLHGGVPGAFDRAATIRIDGALVRACAPIDMLVQACAHPHIDPRPGNGGWAADAAMILARSGLRERDWPTLAETAARRHVAMVLAVRLHALAGIGVPVPEAGMARLLAVAKRRWREERDMLLSTVLGATRRSRRGLMREVGWPTRLQISLWTLDQRLGRIAGLP